MKKPIHRQTWCTRFRTSGFASTTPAPKMCRLPCAAARCLRRMQRSVTLMRNYRMKNMGRSMLFGVGALLSGSLASAQPARGTIAFIVTMPDAASQLYHVVMQCDGLTGDSIDFKLPVWSPGYYGILDFAANVKDFKAADGVGHDLRWNL